MARERVVLGPEAGLQTRGSLRVVTNTSLAQSYLIKATKRLRILQVLLDDEAFSDVVREAQEIVELSLKGVLRQLGVEPPHWHDVSPLLTEYRERLPQPFREHVGRIVEVSG